jgi:ferredoxin
VEVFALDLAVSRGRSAFREMIRSSGRRDCLFVGSPVYRDVAVPPVMDLIDALPAVEGVAAAPFVTWGAVTSGIALWQMGRALMEKGFVLAGAAAVVAEHCMMWRSRTPSGAGRPDPEDDRKVKDWARKIFEGLQNGAPPPLPLDALDYHPRGLAEEMKEKLGKPWQIVPKTVNEQTCTLCGVCVEECPVGAISLDPVPVFADACFDCFNCVRLCPEEAIDSPLSPEMIEQHIGTLKEKYGEPAETRVFPGG